MFKRLTLLVCIIVSLSGCLYKMDIHQGNVLDPEQLEKLKTGMSKDQVVALLGSPQLTDPFHTERWDYYSMSNLENQSQKIEKVVTLIFEGNQLKEIIQ
jgi:outer membrane protein assembly factor BamE